MGENYWENHEQQIITDMDEEAVAPLVNSRSEILERQTLGVAIICFIKI